MFAVDVEIAALDKLVAADRMAEAIEDSGKGAVFCTGLGGSVAVSERAVERAKALVGEVAEETSNERSKRFCGLLCSKCYILTTIYWSCGPPFVFWGHIISAHLRYIRRNEHNKSLQSTELQTNKRKMEQ